MPEVRRIPNDGTPLCPSSTFATWREEGAATPLEYSDGHVGMIINRYELARMVLEDKRFSQSPPRMPAHHGDVLTKGYELTSGNELDAGNVLGLDGEQHARIRRTILNRYSVKSARSYESDMKEIIAKQFEILNVTNFDFALTGQNTTCGYQNGIINVAITSATTGVTNFQYFLSLNTLLYDIN
jgi:cytochrome P450